MPIAPTRTLAAEKALQALLRALPPGGALQLCDGQPAVAHSGTQQQLLGRAPLSRAQVEMLLSADALSEGLAVGPGDPRAWTLTLADKIYQATLAWPDGHRWTVTLTEAPGAAAAPAAAAPPGHRVQPTLDTLAGALAPLAAAAPASMPAPAPMAAAISAPTMAIGPSAPVPSLSTTVAAPPTLPSDLHAWLREARQQQAADVHLQAGQPMRRRMAGALVPHGEPIAPQRVQTFVDAMLPAELTQPLRERGSVDFALWCEGAGRFRVNIGRQASGPKICLRVVPDAAQTFEALGLPKDIEAVTHYHQGLAIVAGPTGHGKTTTLAAIVDAINQRAPVHIITVEDPIEVLHQPAKAVISQRQVGLHTRSFARALKGALREDPDVIVIGELRDRETVEIALTAAETGHLVLATMSTRSAAKTVDRLIDLFPPEDQQQVRATLAGALKMVVSQRLVPTRHHRRLPAIEMMTGSVPLWTLIRENKMFQLPSLQQRGRAIGMIRLDSSLEALVQSGDIEPATALSFCEERAEMLRVLREKHHYTPPETPELGKSGGAR